MELSRPRRQGLLGRGRTMTTVAWSGQAAPAVAGRLERRVRPQLDAVSQCVRAHSIASSSRSSPQKSSLPTVNEGAPNTPSDFARAVRDLS
ncbi:MAG: hypothetical protein RL500_1388 [Pseudomonadota bacterium]